jgi:hypothetical protein
MTRETPTSILDHAAELAASRGRLDAQEYAARELMLLGIDWADLPDCTQHDVVARLERAVHTPRERTG